MPLDVITPGEAMVLFAAQQTGPLEHVTQFARSTAGAELNVAIGCARLGLRTGYISRLGADSFGRHITSALQAEGIDTQALSVDAQRATGFMLKSRSDDGADPLIEYHRSGSAASALRLGDLPAGLAAQARHLHLTGIYVAVSSATCELVFGLAQQALEAGRSISFDPNLRPRLWPNQAAMVATLNELAALAHWVLPGLEEGRLLTGQQSPEAVAAYYLERGAHGVAVKLGPQGAYVATASGPATYVPGVPVHKVVDTVGAGDGFAAGFITGLLDGLPPAHAAARGNAIGARVVQFPGDSEGLPTRAELARLPHPNVLTS